MLRAEQQFSLSPIIAINKIMYPEQTIELLAHGAGKMINDLYQSVDRAVKKQMQVHMLMSWLSIEISKKVGYIPENNCIAHILAIASTYPELIGSTRVDFNDNQMTSHVAAPPTIDINGRNVSISAIANTVSNKPCQIFGLFLYRVADDGIVLEESWNSEFELPKITTLDAGRYIAASKTTSGFGVPSKVFEIQ